MFEKKTRYDCIQGWVTAISARCRPVSRSHCHYCQDSGQWTVVSGAEERESDMKLDTRSGHCHWIARYWIPRYEVDTGAAWCFDLHLIGGSHSPEPAYVTGEKIEETISADSDQIRCGTA